MTDDLGTQIALAAAHGLAVEFSGTTDRLITTLKHDSDRYQVMSNALRDFADQLDSRDTAERLYALLCRIEELGPERAATLSRQVNYFNPESLRIDLDAEWSE
jgi:hypothetical protein